MRKLPTPPKGVPAQGAAAHAGQVEAAPPTERQRQRAEALLELIERRKERPDEDAQGLGEALRELQKGRLYVALGHTSFAEMLRARRIMGLTQAKELIDAVSAPLSEQEPTSSTGQTSPLEPPAAASPDDPPSSPRDRTAERLGERASEISARGPAQAAGTMREKTMARGSKPQLTEEREAMQAAHKLQAWLRERGARDAIAVAHKGDGGWCLQVELRVDHVDRLTGEDRLPGEE